MKQFVPLSDDALYSSVDPPLMLVPYQSGIPCHHALRESERDALTQRWNSSVSPGLTPSLSAVPPLSSSTYLAGPLLG